MRRKRKRRPGRMSTLKAGAIGLALLLIFTYLGFTKFANPFASPYTVHAVFSSANGLRPDSLVRIAGVNVGKVQSVSPVSGCKSGQQAQRPCSAADVVMTVEDQGLPIHKDATFAIRPRIFLEGNFFVDIIPGTPEAPTAPSGYVFPVQQGVEPVQLDQVLTSLQSDTRHNLQLLLQQYGSAVSQAGPSYNSSIQFWLPAYEYSAIVSHDALGVQPHDLSNFIYKQGDVSAALDTNPPNLKSLVTDFNTTANAFARQNVALANAVAQLPKTLSAAIPALTALNATFCSGSQGPNCAPGPLPQLAKALIPGAKSTGPMVDASLPFVTQLRKLVQPAELRGLTADLAVTVPALTKLTQATIPFQRDQIRPASSCVKNVVLPWSNLTLNDPNFNSSNGFPPRKAYVEAVDFLPGLAGESRVFDANGPYIRVLGTGGTATYSLQPGLFGQALTPIMGTAPQMPPGGHRPPLQPNVPCETQPAITDLSTPAGGAPQQMNTNLSAPGALLRQTSSGLAAIASIRDVAKQQDLGVNVLSKAPKGK
jgi:phospholipid/cholesterol/gamma-HCH transport system substrate-binding protein